MAVPNFSDNFSQKDWYKFRMAKSGCSEFFPTIFPKKTGIIQNCQKYAFIAFIEAFLVQKDWKKFGMAKNGHCEFI